MQRKRNLKKNVQSPSVLCIYAIFQFRTTRKLSRKQLELLQTIESQIYSDNDVLIARRIAFDSSIFKINLNCYTNVVNRIQMPIKKGLDNLTAIKWVNRCTISSLFYFQLNHKSAHNPLKCSFAKGVKCEAKKKVPFQIKQP